MGDESIHDHSSAFQSYIVSGGYENELYRVTCKGQEDFKFQLDLKLTKEQLWNLYEKYVASTTLLGAGSTRKFKFSIDKATKNITYQGAVMLRMTGTETTKRGDIVNIDSMMIHRVSKYHMIPDEKTLSMNIVRGCYC